MMMRVATREAMVKGQQWSVSINVGVALEGDAGSIVSYGGIVAVAVAAGSCGRGGHDRGWGCAEEGIARSDKGDGAMMEALGSTSKGWQQRLRRVEGEAGQQQRRLRLRGLQATDEGGNSRDRSDGNNSAAVM
ncbi:hypothetical protein BHE74_00009028 [Ensete ventricosum]|nr:hypothetical protein BHE74_00009028 [Ensete ventricosum]